MRTLCAVGVMMWLCACASPQTVRPVIPDAAVAQNERELTLYALEARAADYRRVYAIADRLRTANAELCPEREPALGFMIESVNDYANTLRPAARELWGLSTRPSVVWVGEHSAAARAGLQTRDALISVNGEALDRNGRSTRAAYAQLRRAAKSGRLEIGLLRQDAPVTVTFAPAESCGYPIFMSDSPEINAFADSENIVLFRGMLRFANNDNELAALLGHELAHNAMLHIQAGNHNRLMGSVAGSLLDGLAALGGLYTNGAFSGHLAEMGGDLYSQQFESEADYVGMYFVVRAGYSPIGVEDVWRRMSIEYPEGIRLATTHPSYAQRVVQLAAARAEIDAKRAAGEPLLPNMQSR